MFGSWGRSAPEPVNTPEKHRSIPIPLQDHDNTNDFKNSSSPQQSDPTAAPKAEFSTVKPKFSAQSLRRFVKGIEPPESSTPPNKTELNKQAVKEPSKEPSKEPIKADAEPSTSDQESRKDNRWFWQTLKGQKIEDASPDASKGSAWAFWAKDSNSFSNTESGSLAVSGTGTEQDPRKVEVNLPAAKRQKTSKPSIVVPQFESIQNPSRTSRLAKYLWASSGFSSTTQQAPYRPKRAVVIGVHGYFPAKMTRAILGEPTGTSIKFANEAESRLNNWFNGHFPGHSLKIDKIALEGEGKIQYRVDKLYKLLLNWESLLREADFIFFASHSQGSVVTMTMIAKLIEAGILNRKQRVSALSMAGSIIGPMPGMDQTLVMKAITRIEHDSLIELFQLQNPNSDLSRELRKSFATALSFGTKVTLISSADDQLIPVYSALATNIRHPNLFRGIYIDGDDVVPDVIAPLLQLAAVQLNEGQTDHGVIGELSGILAGALTSKGHSKLYNSDTVYDLGLRLALETSISMNWTPTFDTEFKIPKPSGNPYLLPWAANALVSDSRNSRQLQPVLHELHSQFKAWKPATKQMKDLKTRLAGISRMSKL